MGAGPARILIVDDYASLRESFCLILAGLGYCVRSAEDASSAWAEIRAEVPDLLLYDLDMPGRCGFEFLASIRLLFPAVHVVAMNSSYAGASLPESIPADALYDKSSGPGRLVRSLESMLNPERRSSAHSRTARLPTGGAESSSFNAKRESSHRVACPVCPSSMQGIEAMPGIDCSCEWMDAGLAPAQGSVVPFARRRAARIPVHQEHSHGILLQMPRNG